MKKKSLLLTVLLALGFFSVRAEDTIRVFTFAANDMTGINYGLSATLASSDIIDDTAAMSSAHTVPGAINVWTRISDSATFAENYATVYPRTNMYIGVNYILSRMGVANNPGASDDGFMFFTYSEQTTRNGNFNTHFSLPAVPCPSNTQLVEVRLTQAYYKYFDRCFIDYKVNGSWYSREINVTGIDCQINSGASYHPSYTMPSVLAAENNIELRIRAYCDGNRGNAYGYFWAVDNVAIVSGNPDQWTFGPEHFLDGKYGVVPQGMQVPLTWFAPVKNTGVTTQTGVNVSMTHTSPSGATTTFLQQSFPSIAPSASFDTLAINPRGLYNNWGMNWPYYMYNPMGTGTGLPTAVEGLQSVQTTVSSNSLNHSFSTYNYRVSTADAYDSYAWGHGNGVLVGGMEGFCYGYSPDGYIRNSASDSYYSASGHQVLVRLAAGSTIPTDVTGLPWRIHGVEMVVAPGIDAEGIIIEPKLYQLKYDDNYGYTRFLEIPTGVVSYTVSANELNTLDTGYLLPGQYNTLRLIFPAQPTLEPGGIYYIGYRLPNEANFALANTYELYKTNLQPDGSYTIVQFADNPQLAPYANTFKPEYNELLVSAYNPSNGQMSWIYGGYNIHSWPMINMLVGPMQPFPSTYVIFDCSSGNSSVKETENDDYCNDIYYVALTASHRFTISSSQGYRLDSICVNGVNVTAGGNVETISQSVYDSDDNLTALSSYNRYQLLLENITTSTVVQVHTSPLPTHTVTVNCPVGVEASLWVTGQYGSDYVPACGTFSYTAPDTLLFRLSLPDSQMVDYLLIDGDTLRLGDNAYFRLAVGNADHVVDIVLRAPQTYTATFINEGGGYMYGFLGDAEQQVYDSVQLSGNMQTSGLVHMVSFLPTSGYFGQMCDSTNSTLLHFYVDGVEIPLSSLNVYDYTEEDGFIGYSYSYQLDTSHTFRAVFGPAFDTLCLAPTSVFVSDITDSTARISWSGYADNYHLVLQQLDAGNNVIASSASTIASRATTLTSLLPGTNYRVLVASICGSDTTDFASTSFTTATTVTITLQNPDDGQMYYKVNNNDFIRVTGSDALTYNTGSASSFQIICFSDLPGSPFYGTTDSDTSVARLTHLFVDGISIPVYADTTIAAGSFTVTMGSDYYTHVFTPNLNSSHTILARFGSWYDSIPAHVPDTFTVAATASDTSMGTVLGAGRYTEDSIATLTAIPAPCHLFNGWSDGVVDNPRSLTVSADTAITALFAPVATAFGGETATACDSYTWNGQTYTASGTYTFATSTVAGCDSIATLSLTLNYSVADTLEATATESYDWNGQTYTESGVYTYSGTTAHGCDSTVTLLLTIEPPVVYYTVTVASSDDAMGSVLGGGTYEAGTEVTLTAMPAEGHEFVQWNDGLADNPRTLVLTSDTAFTAQFQPEVGIDDVDATTVTLHPNPATTTVTLAGLEPGAQVTIVDLNGREISKFKIQNSEFEIDVTSLASGAYFVRITDQRQNAIRKLIVK